MNTKKTDLNSAIGENQSDGAEETASSEVQTLLQDALNFHQQGNFREAEKGYKRVLAISPAHAEALFHYSKLAQQCGDLNAAEKLIKASINANGSAPASWLELGMVLRFQKDLKSAEEMFNKALSLSSPDDPNHAVALNNLGTLMVELENYEESLDYFKRAVETAPTYNKAYKNYIVMLGEIGYSEDALENIENFIKANGKTAEMLAKKGSLLIAFGRFDEAQKSFEQAVDLDPTFGSAKVNLARIMAEQGSDLDQSISIMEEMSAEIEDGSNAQVNFALYKAYSKKGEYDRAFEHLAQGNEICKSKIPNYDVSKVEAMVECIISTFDADWVNRYRDTGCTKKGPILIVGMPRSGTTLTEQILASHSEVAPLGELADFQVNVRTSRLNFGFTDDSHPEDWSSIDPAALSVLGEGYIQSVSRNAKGLAYYTDKNPLNFMFLGLAWAALPYAKLIHCKRDPVATCFSCYEQPFKLVQGFSFALESAARFYNAYRRLMDHWRKVLPADTFHEVTYEDMITDQEAETQRMLDYCGLEWEDGCLEFYKTKRVVKTASVYQVRKPIYNSSLERWRNYESHLGPLLEILNKNDQNGQ